MVPRPRPSVSVLALICGATVGCPAPQDSAPSLDLWTHTIDVHAHIRELEDDDDRDQIADAVEDAIEGEGLQLIVLLPPPAPSDPNSPIAPVEGLIGALGEEREPIAFLGGGASLNSLLQRAVFEGETSESLRAEFEARALDLAELGVLGFGELALEHLALGVDHPYLHAPADHELMLLMADLAAAHDLPIDVHMEAVAEELTLSEAYTDHGNPDTLAANIEAFERLLEHNRDARIIWGHAGWDNTGHRTPELTQRLLDDHPNLFMSIKVSEDCPEEWSIVDGKGIIRDDWQALLGSHPERFMLGTDYFFVPLGLPSLFSPDRIPTTLILDQLPEGVAEWVGHETAVAVYGLEDRTF